MILMPVIERELRASARQPATYWVRVLGVLALLGMLCLEVGLADTIGPQVGGRLFGVLHGTLLCAIWVLVPLLTADCISRERREGTLPLLFLTPLKARDIVCAKGMAHGLRAMTLWLAVLPIVAVPLLAGGVGGPEFLMAALVNLSSLFLAIAAGILASAACRVWSRALAVAMCLGFSFAVMLLLALPIIVSLSVRPNARRFNYLDSGLGAGFMLVANPGGIWQEWMSRLRGSSWSVVQAYFFVSLCSGLALLLVILFAAWCVKRVWREEPPSARLQWLNEMLTRPMFFQPWLKRWLHWQLHRNPIGWLEQRSWSSRLVVWSWFAVVVCIYSSLFANLYLWQRAFHGMQSLLASLLVGSIALSAAGSFRRERETGVLELLLVAPMQEWQIIMGRIWGLWTQFLPSIVLLCSVWLYCATFLVTQSEENEVMSVVFYCVAFATLPGIGLYFSLAKSNYMASLLWTLFVGIGLPAMLSQLIVLWLGLESLALAWMIGSVIVQLLIAALLTWRLHDNLKRRKFAMQARAS